MTSKRHLFACLLLGCNGSGGARSSGEAADSAAVGPDGGPGDPGRDPGAAGEAVAAEPPGVALPRGLVHEATITEVWLDPRASAALSLDASGGVRLWPTLPGASEDLAELAPIRVPLREPTSLALARAGAGTFVIAAIDTIQAGRVLAIELDAGEGGSGEARVHERFAIPPSEPLLELHVFDGGDRILALGVDHRLTLYDGHGRRLAELVEYGLAPWQLRIAGPPEAPQLAMILVGPTRIQRLALADDQIKVVGEARPFVLDRGPNHNDLALMPSGEAFAVFRRPKPRGQQWSLEVHDFETGEVRVVWGEVESKFRPRLHIVDDRRALLEDGSGAGFWVDLSGGVVMPAPFELPEELDELPPESHVSARRVELPGATVSSRRHASVVAGLRAVPLGSGLFFDPVDADHHHHVRQDRFSAGKFALDHDGRQLALALYGDELVVDSLAERRTQTVVGCTRENQAIFAVAFGDPDHLVLVESDRATICAWRTGTIVSEIELPGFGGVFVRVTGPGAGVLGIEFDDEDSDERDEPAKVSEVSFTNNQWATLEPVERAAIAERWPELHEDRKLLALDGEGRRYTRKKVNARDFDITTASGEQRKLTIADDRVVFERFVASADGHHAAIIHERGSEYDEDYTYYYSYYDPPSTLTVWSIAGDEPTPQWSIPVAGWLELAWSGDGKRIAVKDPAGGVRVLTAAGELVAEREGRGLELERLPDAPAPSE